jgi:hypothetical protein
VLRVLDDSFAGGPNGTDLPCPNRDVRVVNNIFAFSLGASHDVFLANPDMITGVIAASHNLFVDLAMPGTTAARYSDIAFAGEPSSLYGVDPGWVAPTADLHLRPASPAIGAGVPVTPIWAPPELSFGTIDGERWADPPNLGAE